MEKELTQMVETAISSPLTSPPEAVMITLLYAILEELAEMNQANEPDIDAEPDPFQTLNGPNKDPNPLRYGVKGEYGE